MGCSTDVVVLKKESLQRFRKEISGYKYTGLCSKVLVECYDFVCEETDDGRWILSTNLDVLERFFAPSLEADTIRRVSERLYKNMILWLEQQLRNKTLLECAVEEECDWEDYKELCSIYRELKNAKIDFSKEILVISVS